VQRRGSMAVRFRICGDGDAHGGELISKDCFVTGALAFRAAAGEREEQHRQRGVTPQCEATVPTFFSEIETPMLCSAFSNGR